MAAIGPKKAVFLLKRFFPAGCALILAAASCTAQQNSPTVATPSTAPPAPDASTPPAPPAQIPAAAPPASIPAAVPPLERKIENMIRSELGVPPQYQVAIGPRQKSDVNGYDSITVTFSLPSQPEKKQMVNFLLSKDSNTLAR